MFKCKKCDKSFKSARALQGHQRVHSDNYAQVQTQHTERLCNQNLQKHKTYEDNYYKNPIKCHKCGNIILYAKQVGINKDRYFCNSSCAASYNNKLRLPKSKETRTKISNSVKEYNRNNPKPIIKQMLFNFKQPRIKLELACGPFSKIYLNTCSHCDELFGSRTRVKYCLVHSNLYKSNNRNRYAFTFSLSKYPDLFGHMSQQLKELGMWSYSNTTGLTRDHKISVNESIRNNYDPYYIKHPLNCELMSWIKNNKKKTKSSITFPELKILVDNYDNKR